MNSGLDESPGAFPRKSRVRSVKLQDDWGPGYALSSDCHVLMEILLLFSRFRCTEGKQLVIFTIWTTQVAKYQCFMT